MNGSSVVLSAQQAIVDRWNTAQQPDQTEVCQFIEELAMLPPNDQQLVCKDMPFEVFQSMASLPLPLGALERFIQIYLEMSEQADYGWSFAEIIANNMTVLFNSPFSSETDKANALKAAIIAAERQNRFAAMDSCKIMIASVQEGGLAQRVFEIMIQYPNYFMENIDPFACRSQAIQQAIAILRANTAAELQRASLSNPFPE